MMVGLPFLITQHKSHVMTSDTISIDANGDYDSFTVTVSPARAQDASITMTRDEFVGLLRIAVKRITGDDVVGR